MSPAGSLQKREEINMFGIYQSVKEILEYPGISPYMEFLFHDWLRELFPKEFYGAPLALAEQRGRTPWGEPLSIIADQLLDAANLSLDLLEGRRKAVLLWDPQKGSWLPGREPEPGNVPEGKEKVFLIGPQALPPAPADLAPAVIICPGGGYEDICYEAEGTPVLKRLEAAGIRAFLLNYEIRTAWPRPQMDLALAILYVRSHADEYGIDPGRVFAMGTSAGGHLCATEAADHEALKKEVLKGLLAGERRRYETVSARPDGVILSYPVISLEEETHEGSARIITGKRQELRRRLSAERLAAPDYPSTFLWACHDDDCVPCSNARRMAQALEKQEVGYELHIYPSGGHGCGLAYAKEAWPWSEKMIRFIKELKNGYRN